MEKPELVKIARGPAGHAWFGRCNSCGANIESSEPIHTPISFEEAYRVLQEAFALHKQARHPDSAEPGHSGHSSAE